MDLKEQILVALGLNKEKEVTLAWQSKSEDGTIFVSTAEELEAGVDISVLTEDGTTILLPVGTYKTETVEEEEMSEESVELAPEDDDRKEEADVADWKGMEKRIQNLEDAVADLKREKVGGDDEVEEMATEEVSDKPKSIKTTETVEFSAEVEAIKAENEKLKTELAESPADAPINTNKFSSDKPVLNKREYNRLSRRERFIHDLNK